LRKKVGLTGGGGSTSKVKGSFSSVKSTPQTPKTVTSSKFNTPASKKRKTQGDDSDDDDEINISRREAQDLTVSPSSSRQNSLSQKRARTEAKATPRQRRAASAKVAEYIKKEKETYDSDEESKRMSTAESDMSEFDEAELGV
jgi:hypothetical protein